MLALSEYHEPAGLNDRLRDAHAATPELMSDVISETCRHLPSASPFGKTARIDRLIGSEAWTDAALALIELKLPQWQIRRIAYDGGEWHCALSRQPELPEWLDQAIEARHADLPLAILSAFVEAKAANVRASRTSVPLVPCNVEALYEPVLSDNFA